jgi:hypothetical protein
MTCATRKKEEKKKKKKGGRVVVRTGSERWRARETRGKHKQAWEET